MPSSRLFRIPRITVLVVAATIALSGLMASGVQGINATDRAEAASVNWGFTAVSLKFNRAETRCLANYSCSVDRYISLPGSLVGTLRAGTAIRAYWALHYYGCNLKISLSYGNLREMGWGLWGCS